jgi:S-adenosylmethionine hydrolase
MKTRPEHPVITLITDFGTSDHYVGAMKGVMLGICPQAQVVDISHDVTPYAIPEGAFTVAQAWSCFPAGTVHLVVVDPGVGSARRPVLVEAAGHYFVGPDNGVLTMLYDAVPTHSVWHITASRYFRDPVSRTFHGRDVFAPVAAHLAYGVDPPEFGVQIREYQRLGFTRPVLTGPNTWTGTILSVDRFGNLITNFDSQSFARLINEPFELKIGNSRVHRMAESYAEMQSGSLFVIAGSAGYLEVSCNRDSAARIAKAFSGDLLELSMVTHTAPPNS